MKMPARLLVGGIALTACAHAFTAEETTMTNAARKAAYENRFICERQYVTGSLIPKRVCRTQAQIDELHEITKRYADEIRRNSGWNAPPTGVPMSDASIMGH